MMADQGLPIINCYVSIVFYEVNEVLKSCSKLAHILLYTLSVFFLRFWIALQQLHQSAYVADLFIVRLEIRLEGINLVLHVNCTKTGLCNSFKLHFQKSHISGPLSTINVCTLVRQILETSWVGRIEGSNRILVSLVRACPERWNGVFIQLKIWQVYSLTLVSWEWANLCLYISAYLA